MSEPLIRHYGPRAYADHPPFSYPDYRSTVKRSRLGGPAASVR